ncbi:MAG: hypothetical protein HY220_03000 [Candidatus Sungbacteria bacterium]|uniref:Uncharacterized protein n=1 Tax=Candidatus Sungiibacteriota bacterium TaxID=2750080 RepID=A0A9D6LRF5_9BACT|nr:hypothetical protein [Candidatus Sungbacteria bacterium]
MRQHGLIHIHKRERHHQPKLEPFPSKKPLVRLLDTAALANGILSPFASLPQLFYILRTHQTSGVSALTWLLLGLSSIVWSTYGFYHRAWPIVISSIISLFLDCAIILAVMTYR